MHHLKLILVKTRNPHEAVQTASKVMDEAVNNELFGLWELGGRYSERNSSYSYLDNNVVAMESMMDALEEYKNEHIKMIEKHSKELEDSRTNKESIKIIGMTVNSFLQMLEGGIKLLRDYSSPGWPATIWNAETSKAWDIPTGSPDEYSVVVIDGLA